MYRICLVIEQTFVQMFAVDKRRLTVMNVTDKLQADTHLQA
jgi:hypothetical protein